MAVKFLMGDVRGGRVRGFSSPFRGCPADIIKQSSYHLEPGAQNDPSIHTSKSSGAVGHTCPAQHRCRVAHKDHQGVGVGGG